MKYCKCSKMCHAVVRRNDRLYARGHAPNSHSKDVLSIRLITRFWSKVDKSGGLDSCWPWLGSVNKKGYGRAMLCGIRGSHRVAYYLRYGEVYDFVCHKCDNPPCVNPRHLFLGTNQDNVRDFWAKGLGPDRSGVHNGNHKLSPDVAVKIRKAYVPGFVSYGMLGRRFGVSSTLVGNIIRGEAWVQ